MPESDTIEIDYYPAGWTEEIMEETFIEWVFNDDQDIFVRLDGTMGDADYSVSAITGINQNGEEFVSTVSSGLSKKAAFEMAESLIYAMNGAIGRTSGDSEFSG